MSTDGVDECRSELEEATRVQLIVAEGLGGFRGSTAYAAAIDAPVLTDTTVTRLRANHDGYQVTTNHGTWTCASVVVASGACNIANVPAIAAAVPTSVQALTPMTYRSPHDLNDRGVLIVGASATGVQLADEIHRTGRPVTIAVGGHVRLPRTYRGRDIHWWMDAAGVLDEQHDHIDDLIRARHLPSPQLIGTTDHQSIDLNTLRISASRSSVGSARSGTASPSSPEGLPTPAGSPTSKWTGSSTASTNGLPAPVAATLIHLTDSNRLS